MIVTNPVKVELDRSLHDKLLADGLAAATASHITGKAVTPFLLEYFHRVSEGKSLDVNVEIIKSNSKLAAEIAPGRAEGEDGGAGIKVIQGLFFDRIDAEAGRTAVGGEDDAIHGTLPDKTKTALSRF